MNNLEHALAYATDGWAVVPLNKEKKPLLSKDVHGRFLSEAASEKYIEAWWKKYPDANIGLACGKVSGRTVIDIDDGEDIFPDTYTVRTPTGGFHKYYQYSPVVGNEVGSNGGHYKGIDIRNDRGYIVAPPSHCVYEKKGKKIDGVYEVVDSLPAVAFPEHLFQGKGKEKATLEPVVEGGRNNKAAQVIGLLIRKAPKDDMPAAWELIKAWNRENKPPMDERELKSVFNSIWKREQDQPKVSVIGDVEIYKDGTRYVLKFPVAKGSVRIDFSQVMRSHQALDVVMRVQPTDESEGELDYLQQRINLLSNSAVSNFVTTLNNAFGGKKEGRYNWTIIINKAGNALQKHLLTQEKPEKLDLPYKQDMFLLAPFLQEDVCNMLYADSEVGKSYFMLQMAVCMALGVPFMGHPTQGGIRTLFLDYEDSRQSASNRIREMCLGMGVEFEKVVPFIEWRKPSGSVRDAMEQISEWVTEGKFQHIIIDAGSNACGGSPNDEERVITMFNALEMIPCTKTIIHHEPKDTQGKDETKAFYGSNFWRALVRVAWRLTLESQEGGVKTIKAVIAKKSNMPPVDPFVYTMEWQDPFVTELPHTSLVMRRLESIKGDNTKEKVMDALKKYPEGLSKKQIVELSASGIKVVEKWLSYFQETGEVGIKKMGHNSFTYTLNRRENRYED